MLRINVKLYTKDNGLSFHNKINFYIYISLYILIYTEGPIYYHYPINTFSDHICPLILHRIFLHGLCLMFVDGMRKLRPYSINYTFHFLKI